MKKAVLIIMGLVLSMSVFAQNTNDESKYESFFGSKEPSLSGYGGLEMRGGLINDESAIFLGGRGGLIIDHGFSIGLGGYGVVTNHGVGKIANGLDSVPGYLRMGYGGLYLNFTLEPMKKVHFTGNILIGAGGATYTPSWNNMIDWDDDDDCDWSQEGSAFFVIEPSVGVELNMLSFMRVELNAGYRYVSGLDLSKTKNSDVSGFSGGLTFKFGKF